jgi:hypothetical protein
MSKLFNINEFTLSAVPKYYKARAKSTSLGVQIPNSEGSSYLWITVSNDFKTHKPAFTEGEFLKSGMVTFLELKLDSYKTKEGKSRFSTSCKPHNILLGVDLGINMGKISGVVTLKHPKAPVVRIESPYPGMEVNDGKKIRKTKVKEVNIVWPDRESMPEVNAEIFVLGKVRLDPEGEACIQAMKQAVIK